MGYRQGGLGKLGRALAVALPCALIALLVPVEAGASSWTTAQLPGAAGKVFLLGVSCPTQSLCVAVGTNNLIASSTDPAGGAPAWDFGYAGEGPWEGTESWTTPDISGRQIQGVSCPSARLCVAVTDQGFIYSTTHPTGPASTWGVAQIDDGKGRNTHLFGVSCPTEGLCVVVSGKRADQGKIFTSTDPTGGASAWSSIELGEEVRFRGISCGTPSLCVAVTDDGRVFASTDPTGSASAWDAIGSPAGPGSLRAVSCAGVALCLSGNQGGNLLTTTNPAGGLAGWSEVNGGGSVQITGASCPSASECLAVDNNGDVITSTDPTGGASAWSFANLMPFTSAEGNALFAASCPSGTLCVATGARGRIIAGEDPFSEAPDAGGQPGRAKRPKRPRVRIARVHVPLSKEIRRGHRKILIRFYARGKVRGFSCRIDQRPFKSCRSPVRYRLGRGRHVFLVRATGLTGLQGPVAREDFVVGPFCEKQGHGEKICQK